ncbi:MAG: dimethylmenaquinone methyltransferase, partial [Acidobacteria bacterium]|nr:dimethylmenaquinone methyltransferase [Acidobacteriota bacterium]
MKDQKDSAHSASRRDFLKTSALAAAAVVPGAVSASAPAQAAAPGAKDPYALAARFNRFLRITDVTDGLDAVGRADLTLLDPSIRPLWMGMRFFGPAVTLRVLPTNRRMPVVKREDALKQHDIWGEMGGWHADADPHLKPGCVITMSTGGARECGYWG